MLRRKIAKHLLKSIASGHSRTYGGGQCTRPRVLAQHRVEGRFRLEELLDQRRSKALVRLAGYAAGTVKRCAGADENREDSTILSSTFTNQLIFTSRGCVDLPSRGRQLHGGEPRAPGRTVTLQIAEYMRSGSLTLEEWLIHSRLPSTATRALGVKKPRDGSPSRTRSWRSARSSTSGARRTTATSRSGRPRVRATRCDRM